MVSFFSSFPHISSVLRIEVLISLSLSICLSRTIYFCTAYKKPFNGRICKSKVGLWFVLSVNIEGCFTLLAHPVVDMKINEIIDASERCCCSSDILILTCFDWCQLCVVLLEAQYMQNVWRVGFRLRSTLVICYVLPPKLDTNNHMKLYLVCWTHPLLPSRNWSIIRLLSCPFF